MTHFWSWWTQTCMQSTNIYQSHPFFFHFLQCHVCAAWMRCLSELDQLVPLLVSCCNSFNAEACLNSTQPIILLSRMFFLCWDVSSIHIRLSSLSLVSHDSFSTIILRLTDVSIGRDNVNKCCTGSTSLRLCMQP